MEVFEEKARATNWRKRIGQVAFEPLDKFLEREVQFIFLWGKRYNFGVKKQ